MTSTGKHNMTATLSFDPQHAVTALSKSDKRLAKIIRQYGPCTLAPEKLTNVFHALMKAIVYQQLSGKAASTIFSRVLAIHPEGRKTRPEQIVATPDETLRAAGLSLN
jgi:3-methyladenine DNA glycosylase/8-oxoguanine DNA glycosylase